MQWFENRPKSMFLMQLVLGIVGLLFVIIGWMKDLHPGYTLAGVIILSVMMIMNGMEQYVLSKKKGYFLFTIIVAVLFSLFWVWRYQAVIQFY